MFEGCIKRFLGDKIVVLVTHQLQYLKRADQIVLIHDGVMERVGPYADLMLSDADFSELMKGQTAMNVEEKELEKAIRAVSITSAAFNSMIDIEGKKVRCIMITRVRSTIWLLYVQGDVNRG